VINSLPPPVQVEQLVADRRPYLIDRIVRLPSLTREVTIDYTALSLVAPRKVRFRYKLLGVDNDWQDVRRQTSGLLHESKTGSVLLQRDRL
jgi:hypothetical protein